MTFNKMLKQIGVRLKGRWHNCNETLVRTEYCQGECYGLPAIVFRAINKHRRGWVTVWVGWEPLTEDNFTLKGIACIPAAGGGEVFNPGVMDLFD